MMLRPALLLIATTSLAATAAHAGPPLSVHPIPSSEPVAASESPPASSSPSGPIPLQDRTHIFMMPTGNVLRAGEVTIRSHALFTYDQLSYGLTDNIELGVSGTILAPVLSAGIRAQLMPRSSSLRLLVTGGVWTAFEGNDDDSAFSSSATLAYQSASLNLHVTLGALWPADDGYDSGDPDFIALASTGAVLGSGRYSFFIEIGQVGPPESDEVIPGAMAGLKITGEHFEADLGFIGGVLEDDYLHFLPFLSTSYRF